jgi:hypothetical protein
MNNTEYTDIVTRLDRIEALLSTRKAGRKAGVVDPRTDLTRVRVDTLESLFWKIVNSPRAKKSTAYRVPEALLGIDGTPNIEAVVLSVLLNQASLRKVFRTSGLGDSHKETPLDRARRALVASNLVVLPISKLRLGAYVETQLAVSPGEVERKGREVDCGEPVGWTTTSRAVRVKSREGEWIDPPADPCGVRVWPGVSLELEEDDETEDLLEPVREPVEVPRKHPRVVFTPSNS